MIWGKTRGRMGSKSRSRSAARSGSGIGDGYYSPPGVSCASELRSVLEDVGEDEEPEARRVTTVSVGRSASGSSKGSKAVDTVHSEPTWRASSVAPPPPPPKTQSHLLKALSSGEITHDQYTSETVRLHPQVPPPDPVLPLARGQTATAKSYVSPFPAVGKQGDSTKADASLPPAFPPKDDHLSDKSVHKSTYRSRRQNPLPPSPTAAAQDNYVSSYKPPTAPIATYKEKRHEAYEHRRNSNTLTYAPNLASPYAETHQVQDSVSATKKRIRSPPPPDDRSAPLSTQSSLGYKEGRLPPSPTCTYQKVDYAPRSPQQDSKMQGQSKYNHTPHARDSYDRPAVGRQVLQAQHSARYDSNSYQQTMPAATQMRESRYEAPSPYPQKLTPKSPPPQQDLWTANTPRSPPPPQESYKHNPPSPTYQSVTYTRVSHGIEGPTERERTAEGKLLRSSPAPQGGREEHPVHRTPPKDAGQNSSLCYSPSPVKADYVIQKAVSYSRVDSPVTPPPCNRVRSSPVPPHLEVQQSINVVGRRYVLKGALPQPLRPPMGDPPLVVSNSYTSGETRKGHGRTSPVVPLEHAPSTPPSLLVVKDDPVPPDRLPASFRTGRGYSGGGGPRHHTTKPTIWA
eukprot:TRINITY_DN8844_c0_g1_i1.p1 TRINITY_DN8844_c0_g1~~TRINITY_DN8844_c0_g1_i1.p1  ORF type:complete len:626 (+),score=95.41 TRINITY_DN8844_c0_g1_i1:621-2498(+)